jgi:hypothetical protein
MWLTFFKKWIKNLAIYFPVFGLLIGWGIIGIPALWPWFCLLVVVIASFIAFKEASEESEKKYKEEKTKREQAEKDAELWKQSLLEKNSGFKTLVAFISEYEKLRDDHISKELVWKSHPARKAAEVVKEQTQLRRKAQLENKITQAQIELYEEYAPFLAELKDDIPDESDVSYLHAYSEEEQQDAVIKFVTKEEYRKLSPGERNQLALDRFWQRNKSKWLMGKLYERYVGYLYEQNGYEVEYFGISEKYEDMGRDLICHKGKEVLIVQCKNWAQFRTIYEKHIFQLFGTAFEYRKKNPTKDVKAVFYTSTHLSDLAREISGVFGIQLFEKQKLDRGYPCIKCNISGQTREKIYHLPFDQRYDDTKIDKQGEMYCATVAEAEAAGFRRAFRWRGTSE